MTTSMSCCGYNPVKTGFTQQELPAILTEIAQFFSAHFPQRDEGAYLVGGFLRDSLLSGEIGEFSDSSGPHDMDIAVPPTAHSVEDLGRELARHLGGVCQPHNLARGVYQVILKSPSSPEAAPLVIDLVRYARTIEEDMERRDFTVNAMALPLDHPCFLDAEHDDWPIPAGLWAGDLVDPFGGRADVIQRRIRVVNDQHGTPCAAASIAAAVWRIAGKLGEASAFGTYHFSSAPPTTWHEFAIAVFKYRREADPAGPTPDVVAISTGERAARAERPLNSLLDGSRLADDYGVAAPDWRDDLRSVVFRLMSG